MPDAVQGGAVSHPSVREGLDECPPRRHASGALELLPRRFDSRFRRPRTAPSASRRGGWASRTGRPAVKMAARPVVTWLKRAGSSPIDRAPLPKASTPRVATGQSAGSMGLCIRLRCCPRDAATSAGTAGVATPGRVAVPVASPSRWPWAADLVADLYRRMPEARITDILLEVDDAIRFTEAFTHLRTGEPRGPGRTGRALPDGGSGGAPADGRSSGGSSWR